MPLSNFTYLSFSSLIYLLFKKLFVNKDLDSPKSPSKGGLQAFGIEIPALYGHQLSDKFCYLQLELSRCCSIVHWSYDLPPGRLYDLM
jgi:hypothetical protein